MLEPFRHAVLVVDRHLRLAVGTQEVDDALLADLGEPLGEAVREPDRHRHEIASSRRTRSRTSCPGRRRRPRRSCRRCPVALLERLVDTHRDVGRLLVDRDDDAARLAVDAVLRVGVADVADRVAGEAGDVDVALVLISPATTHEPGRHHRLARDAAVRVFGEHGVEHRVADLVGHLVGVTLGHRFGREGVAFIGAPTSGPRESCVVGSTTGPPDLRLASSARRLLGGSGRIVGRSAPHGRVQRHDPVARARPPALTSTSAAVPRGRRGHRGAQPGWCRPRTRRRRPRRRCRR